MKKSKILIAIIIAIVILGTLTLLTKDTINKESSLDKSEQASEIAPSLESDQDTFNEIESSIDGLSE